jgi:hypothetical protein
MRISGEGCRRDSHALPFNVQAHVTTPASHERATVPFSASESEDTASHVHSSSCMRGCQPLSKMAGGDVTRTRNRWFLGTGALLIKGSSSSQVMPALC